MKKSYKSMHKKTRNNFIYNHVINNLNKYLIVTIIFITGIIAGVIYVKNIDDIQKNYMVEYVNKFTSTLKENKIIDMTSLLWDSIRKNMLIVLCLWFAGSTVIGLPVVYGMIGYRGFLIGYTISILIGCFGNIMGGFFCVSSMLLQSLIFIPCILALGVSSTSLCQSILKDKRKENIKIEILRHTLFSLLISIGLCISSIVEVYLSTGLIKYIVKFI